MGYYIRVLGTSVANIPLEELRESARPAVIERDENTDEPWEQLVLKHESGTAIALIEKNPVAEGELGAAELQEFLDEVPLYRPNSAVVWLQNYLPNVKVIYAFQVLSGTDVDDGWTLLHRIYNAVWKVAGGILQADGECFTNEEGHTILWQFEDNVAGKRNVAVLVDGVWSTFAIDLGNLQHREAFWNGQAPPGARPL